MSETGSERFNPSRYFINLKGKEYLPVAARIAWFREQCPAVSGWAIRTEPVDGSRAEKFATFRATIVDPEGRVVATATKTEDAVGFADYAEKAETGAIGRALALCGFGTLFAQELDEGQERIVDTPQPPRVQTSQGKAHARHEPGTETRPPAVCHEADCGMILSPSEIKAAERYKEAFGGEKFCTEHGKELIAIWKAKSSPPDEKPDPFVNE